MIRGRIFLGRSQQIFLPHVRMTDSFFERSRGLLGCRYLHEDEGLLITPCNSVHTFFMRFPIDLLFLNRNNTIVKIVSDLHPWRLAMSSEACSVLELATGQALRLGLQKGDQLIWERAE